MLDTLGKYVSPDIAAHLLEAGPTLGGQRLKVSVLFVDVRDFTGV
jgi:adenylate cyclase